MLKPVALPGPEDVAPDVLPEAAPDAALAPRGRVLAFVRPLRRPAGFSLRDKIDLERWSRTAFAAGIGRVRMEPAENRDAAGVGEFLLIYPKGEDWARWGIASHEGGLVELWSMSDGRTMGCYRSLAEALAALVPF